FLVITLNRSLPWGRRKKRHDSNGFESDSSDSDSTVSRTTRQNVLPVFTQKRKQALPGATLKQRRHPPWYNARILEEERPDLAGDDGRINLEREEAALMDMFIRGKSDLQIGDLIITDDNLDELNRKFNRYEVQLKYNEGRYTALYLISRQICVDNEPSERNALFAMKTGIRPYSVNITVRMKRELRILQELRRNRCPYSPIALDSGRVADLPFIVMNLLDRNIEKVREQVVTFKVATALYIAHEALAAISFLHCMGYIHRDIKPTNLCIGTGDFMRRIYLIDYGDTVKKGKKTRYGTPDGYTLPYWSLDAHKREPARPKGDIESWFYVLIDLLVLHALPWSKMYDEKAVQQEKESFWEGKRQIPGSLYVKSIFELIQSSPDEFDYQRVGQMLRDTIDSVNKGPIVLEWGPNLSVTPAQFALPDDSDDLKTAIFTHPFVDKTMSSLDEDVTVRSTYGQVPQRQDQGTEVAVEMSGVANPQSGQPNRSKTLKISDVAQAKKDGSKPKPAQKSSQPSAQQRQGQRKSKVKQQGGQERHRGKQKRRDKRRRRKSKAKAKDRNGSPSQPTGLLSSLCMCLPFSAHKEATPVQS
uniref:non-specific serine/threonine protein kinase n=2 Tax=Haemonchus contortus TaxID=6289 RepID=A0A7I5EA89_HAECO